MSNTIDAMCAESLVNEYVVAARLQPLPAKRRARTACALIQRSVSRTASAPVGYGTTIASGLRGDVAAQATARAMTCPGWTADRRRRKEQKKGAAFMRGRRAVLMHGIIWT
jgi:hypothetical protein